MLSRSHSSMNSVVCILNDPTSIFSYSMCAILVLVNEPNIGFVSYSYCSRLVIY